MKHGSRSGTGRREVWPVLVLLGISVILPAACVLWFMTRAMSNERLAVRQRVADAYRAQLTAARTRLQAVWRDRVDTLSRIDPTLPAPETFARIVREGLADGAVLYDESGRPAYPTVPDSAGAAASSKEPAWEEAERLEYRRGDPAAAARAYQRIARLSSDRSLSARALRARARCLAKSGDIDAAIDVLTGPLGGEMYSKTLDAQGRLIQLDAFLRALELMSGPEHPDFQPTAERLTLRLDDYTDARLRAAQRRFLMRRLGELGGSGEKLPTLAAEEIAASYMARHPDLADSPYFSPFGLPGSWLSGTSQDETPSLQPTVVAQVWQLNLPDRRGVALFTQDRLYGEVERICREQALPPEVSIAVLPPETEPDPDAPFPSLSTGRPLAGWHLSLVANDPGLFNGTANRRTTVYLWTGLLFVALITALATLVARHVFQQVKVARLKNDLVATVTHELKTPLSSMRMLVDTLLDGHYRQDERKTREYLEMIARENARLSRLIDHFLTFSRMERNKTAFDFQVVSPGRIVGDAVESARERLETAGFALETAVEPGLPEIVADPDAMVTVLLNLLDNARKYSDQDRRVHVRAFQRDGRVCFEVRDHGIGMSARTVKRIFDRFYQADRSLARRTGGCGLGLSIVEFVVGAHAGETDVDSRPGEGSTFTIVLPRSDAPAAERLMGGGR